MAFSHVTGMKSTLTCQVLTLVVKKKKTKIKNDYMSASKYCIFFSSLFIAGNEKKTKQED